MFAFSLKNYFGIGKCEDLHTIRSIIQARFICADVSLVLTAQKWPRDSQQPFVLLGFEPRPTETSAPRTTAGPRQNARGPAGFISPLPVHTRLVEAIHELERARAANHSDIAGHGAKAEELLHGAEHELIHAIEAAKAAH
jgi:hypothetical protein